MICVSLSEKNYDECAALIRKYDFAELRADICGFTPQQITSAVAINKNMIVTARLDHDSSFANIQHSFDLLMAAVNAGAAYIDTEVEFPLQLFTRLKKEAHRKGCKIIVSFHDYKGTDSIGVLKKKVEECIERGADIVKIVTTAKSIAEASRVMKLYDFFTNSGFSNDSASGSFKIVAFAMGDAGRFTRPLSLRLGAPFTYVFPDEGKPTALGQYSFSDMLSAIDNFKIIIPSSKSQSQRAIIAAVYSKGQTIIRNYSACNDSEAALAIAKQLGCDICVNNNAVTIKSRGAIAIKSDLIGKGEKIGFNAGESGLLSRLLMAFACYLVTDTDLQVTIYGEGSLNYRDIAASAKAVESSGCRCLTRNHENKRLFPCTISGSLTNKIIDIDGNGGSQIVSGFLMALPLFNKDAVVSISNPTSIPYIRMTLSVIDYFGVKAIKEQQEKDRLFFSIASCYTYMPSSVTIETDWSSASAFLVAESIRLSGSRNTHGILFSNLRTGTVQADEGIVEVLKKCGIGIHETQYGITLSASGRMHAFSYDASNSPDLFPMLALLACFCIGKSRIKGVGRLKEKESNRAETILSELTKLGAEIVIVNDFMYICGGKRRLENISLLHGGEVMSHNDHRIAICLTIASLFVGENICIDETDCIKKSFPHFFETLANYLRLTELY